MFWLGNLGLIILLSSIEKQKYKNNKDKQSTFINKPHTKSWYYLFRSERKNNFHDTKNIQFMSQHYVCIWRDFKNYNRASGERTP